LLQAGQYSVQINTQILRSLCTLLETALQRLRSDWYH